MYKAILFALDGDYVTDHRHETIEDVEEALANQGSRWIFYPFEAVIHDNPHVSRRQKLVSVPTWPEMLAEFQGRTMGAYQDYIRENGEEIYRAFS